MSVRELPSARRLSSRCMPQRVIAPVLASSVLAASALGLFACRNAEPPRAPTVAEDAPVPTPGARAPDRSALPEPEPPVEWAPPSPSTWKLESGVRVYHRQHGSVPLVSLLLVIPRGAETDPPNKDGLTALMVDLLDEGAGSSNALQLSERLQALATDFHATVSVDSIILSMDLIAENFAESVQILADIVRRPRFEEAEFQRRKAQFIAQALASEAEPHTGRRVAVQRALFGTGYGGSLATGTRDTLESITLADVKAQYERSIVGEGAAFVVTGGVERDPVAEELRRAFADFRGEAKVQARPLSAAAGSGKLYFVDYPGAAQSVIGAVRRAPGVEAEDLFAATVFNRSFGEAFTSRINLNLREEKGYTYGAASVFQRYREVGLFGIFSDVRTDVTRASLDEILKELSGLCGPRPLSGAERDGAVAGLLLGYPGTFESIDLLGARFVQLPLYNRPIDWFERWPARISAVTTEEANAAAQRYCERSEYALVVAGDKAKVQKTLDGIGFDFTELDARGRAR